MSCRRGRYKFHIRFLLFVGCYTGPPELGEKVLKPFREDAPVVADLSSLMSFEKVQFSLDMEYTEGRRYYWKSLFLDTLDDEAINAMIGHTQTRPSPLTSIDVWALGGAVGRVGPTETAFARRDALYVFAIESNWEHEGEYAANVR